MITEYPARSGVLCQIRNWRGGGVGDGGADGALVHVVVVEQFEAECLVEAGLEAGGRAGEDVAEQGQVVQEVRVNVALRAWGSARPRSPSIRPRTGCREGPARTPRRPGRARRRPGRRPRRESAARTATSPGPAGKHRC